MDGLGLVMMLVLAAEPSEEGAAAISAPIKEPNLEFTLLGGAWFPRLRGDATLGDAATSKISLDTELGLDRSETVPNFELEIRSGHNADLVLGGFDFNTEGDATLAEPHEFGGLSLLAGDDVESEVDLTSLFMDVGFAFWQPLCDLPDCRDDGSKVIDLRFEGRGGIRWVQVDQSLESGGDSESVDSQWLAAQIGAGVEFRYRAKYVPLLHMLEIDANGLFGPAIGGDGGWMWQVRAGLTWHFTPNIGATIGYRLVEISAEDDDYELEAGLQGLFVAGVVRF